MLNKLDYYEAQSHPAAGLRAAAGLADACQRTQCGLFRRRWSRPRAVAAIASSRLEEALRDPAYSHADGYEGRYGPSWLHRWAMAEKKPKEFYAGEPVVPKWVMDLADVDSE